MSKKEFPTQEEIVNLEQFIRRRKDKKVDELQRDGLQWTRTAWENKLDYEVSWLGIPIIQNPYDIVLMQELLFTLRPDVIVETGIAHGGSLIYYASLFELLGHGQVIGIDIDIREHNRKLLEKHPMIERITMLEGSSTDPAVIARVEGLIKPNDRVMVILDSDHRKPHVYEELRLYERLVTPGSYMVVFDTFMPYLKGLEGASPDCDGNSPMEAVDQFLSENDSFVVDPAYGKFYISSCPRGFLKRVR